MNSNAPEFATKVNKTNIGSSGILMEEGKVLLGKRVDDDPSFPGFWCSPGGGIEFQEGIECACVREFREEVGLDVRVIGRSFFIGERITAEKHTILFFNHVARAYDADYTIQPKALDGFSEVGWFTPDECRAMFKEYKITPLTHQALEHYFRAWGW